MDNLSLDDSGWKRVYSPKKDKTGYVPRTYIGSFSIKNLENLKIFTKKSLFQ